MVTKAVRVVHARWKYHTQLAKMSFDEILDLTAVFYFYLFIYKHLHTTDHVIIVFPLF